MPMFEIDLWQHDHTRHEFLQKDGFVIQCCTYHIVQKLDNPLDYTIINTSHKLIHVNMTLVLCEEVVRIILDDILYDEVLVEYQEFMVEKILSFGM